MDSGFCGRGCAAVMRGLREIDRRLFVEDGILDAVLGEAVRGGGASVLDVGCGTSGALLRRVPDAPPTTGVDLHLPAPEDPTVPRHVAYHRWDVTEIAALFDEASFDCVVALDVIEHLSRQEGLRLLEDMERIAVRRVVVSTPNGFLPQPPTADNPHQEHRSGWSTEDFTSRGYRVVGTNGWRPLRGEMAKIRLRPRRFWWRVSIATDRLVLHRPPRAFQLLAVLDLG